MNGRVEERLRRALAEQAETTRTSPDGWREIQARRAGAGRRPAFMRWTVLAPAAAVAMVLLLVAVASGRDDDRTLRVTGSAEPLHLLPTGVEPRFRLLDVATTTPGGPPPPSTYRTFGRRAPDGVTLEASVFITMPGDRARNGATPDPTPVRVQGSEVILATDPFGQRTARWYQADGREVGLLTYGLSQAELVTVIESLVPADAATAAPALPAGFTPIKTGSMGGPTSFTSQSWEAGDGDRFSVTVTEHSDVTKDDLASSIPGSRATKVRDTTGLFLAQGEAHLVWIERPGTVVSLQASGLSERELIAIAESLRPVDEARWQELIAQHRPSPPQELTAPPDIGPPPGAVPPTNNYFLLLPVRGRSAPPCTASPLVFPERAGGQDVVCYEVAGPRVTADDVESAVAREERGTGRWAVDYTLTSAGAAHMEALFREVGAGGQFAIVVDGRLVSAPRLEGLPAAKGIVTGLDESTARSLADRLTR